MARTTATPGSVLTRRFGPKWLSGFQDDYRKVLVDEWSPYLGGILLVTVAAGLMAGGLFWGVFGGLRLWGDYLNNAIGLGPTLGIKSDLESPLMHRISLMDITLATSQWISLLAVAAGIIIYYVLNRRSPQPYGIEVSK